MNVVDIAQEKDNIKIVLGSNELNEQPLPVFSNEACAFLAKLSATLLADPAARTQPDVVSFAFWCRKSNIQKKYSNYAENHNELRLGRGVAFHIAPSNVPVNFAFSYVFSLLAGNPSIVRIPSKQFPQVTVICNAIRSLLSSHPEVESRTCFITYAANDAISTRLSSKASVRVIWGGDATVAHIKQMPTAPRCIDIAFADRYSIACINTQALKSLTSKELESFADKFFNDTYLMDQNACSSPQIVFWMNHDIQQTTRFWDTLQLVANKRYQLQPASSIDKYVHVCEDILNDLPLQAITIKDGYLTHNELNSLPLSLESLRGKCGYFYEYAIDNFEELAPLLSPKIQTICYYGLDPHKLAHIISTNGITGIDRIVPIGSALDIDIIWDGFDLITTLSRIIDIR